MKGANGNWKNECSVTPSALIAAMPVGASTTLRFEILCFKYRNSVVLPVPALPVRKRLQPVVSIIFSVRSASSLMCILLGCGFSACMLPVCISSVYCLCIDFTYKGECSTYKGTILFSISAQGSPIISPFLDMYFKFSSFIILKFSLISKK